MIPPLHPRLVGISIVLWKIMNLHSLSSTCIAAKSSVVLGKARTTTMLSGCRTTTTTSDRFRVATTSSISTLAWLAPAFQSLRHRPMFSPFSTKASSTSGQRRRTSPLVVRRRAAASSMSLDSDSVHHTTSESNNQNQQESNIAFTYRCIEDQAKRHPESTSDNFLQDDNVNGQHGDFEEDDTIYALSTGNNGGQATAVAVIRISGPRAHYMLEHLLRDPRCDDETKSSNSKNGILLPPARKAVVRTLYDPVTRTALDQSLILRFDAPHSFTGEDVVELHCHGSRAVLQGILEALSRLHPHARLAEAGEFTQRAMFHGKLDLLQVEALADLLTADTHRQRQQALQQLQPGDHQLSKLYSSWRSTLISGLAHAEAVIDFGDDEHLDHDSHNIANNYDADDVGAVDPMAGQWNVWGNVADKMHQLWLQMQHHLSDGCRGELVRSGIKVAIVGPPNAGKSSLFNVLAQREAAIVSPQAGTTRDVLELTLDLGGVKCLLSDTAGLRQETTDMIEQEGMKRARSAALQADVILAVVDGSDPNVGLQALQEAIPPSARTIDDSIDEHNKNANTKVETMNGDELDRVSMLVLNKIDLTKESNIIAETLWTNFSFAETCAISCATNEGIDSFLNALTKIIVARVSGHDDDVSAKGNGAAVREGAMITRARHRQHVQAAADALDRFRTLSQQGSMAVDLAAEELRLAASELGRITGAVDIEDVLDVLFRDFCIGK